MPVPDKDSKRQRLKASYKSDIFKSKGHSCLVNHRHHFIGEQQSEWNTHGAWTRKAASKTTELLYKDNAIYTPDFNNCI